MIYESCGNTNLFKADVSGDTNSPCNHWWDPQKATGEPVISLPWIKAAFFTSRNIDGCRVWSFFFPGVSMENITKMTNQKSETKTETKS